MTTATPVSATSTPSLPTRWTLDASHSSVGFSVRHMMVSNVRGEFRKVTGDATYDPQRPENSKVSVRIDVASIDTRDEKRDGHLRGADFFDAEAHPAITFTSSKVRRKGDGLEVTGELTIRGVTREAVLAIDDVTGEHADPWGNRRMGASGKTKIRRSEYGITWNAALEAGGVLVGDDVTIHLEAEFIKQ